MQSKNHFLFRTCTNLTSFFYNIRLTNNVLPGVFHAVYFTTFAHSIFQLENLC
jgi:hypothetical protein